MNFYTLSDKGKVRPNNEDYAESLQLKLCGPLGNEIAITALILADGMGGAAAGEYASMLAVKTVKDNLVQKLFLAPPEELLNSDKTVFLEECFLSANNAIYKMASENPEMDGMGTTIVSALIYKTGMSLAHVGDSRCYRFRDGNLFPISKDHSLVQELLDQGRITPEQALVHPNRNVITRALGVGGDVEVEKRTYTMDSGDLILLCSDGLCGFVENSAIKKIISDQYQPKNSDLKTIADNLVKAAYLNGGGDNITVCLYQHD